MKEKLLYESIVCKMRRYVRALGAPSRLNRVVDQKPWKIRSNIKRFGSVFAGRFWIYKSDPDFEKTWVRFRFFFVKVGSGINILTKLTTYLYV